MVACRTKRVQGRGTARRRTCDLVGELLVSPESDERYCSRMEFGVVTALTTAPGGTGAVSVVVRYSEMRRDVIDSVAVLADREFQRRVWIRREYPSDNILMT